MKYTTKNDNIRYSWMEQDGPLPVPMTNDYLFKGIYQENNAALKSLICAVLHRRSEEIRSVSVVNPIILGAAIDEKEYVLDVKVELNNDAIIDLEMQVVNYHDWPERSLQYLCRTYDSLHKGQNYLQSKTAIHIGILDFILFRDESGLLDSYRLMNVKTHRVYTEKFQLYILCLPLADVPGEEDRRFHTDVWARFFKAETWEDLKMLAKEDEGVAGAVETGRQLWSDDSVREKALAREDYYRRVRTEQARMKQLQDEKAQLQDEKEQLEDEKEQLQGEKLQLEGERQQLTDTKKRLQEENRQLQGENEQLQGENEQLQEEIRRLREELTRIKNGE